MIYLLASIILAALSAYSHYLDTALIFSLLSLISMFAAGVHAGHPKP